MNNSKKCLIIGYGNSSRNDDGIGIFITENLRDEGIFGTDFLIAQELGLELIETVKDYEKVIFIDASISEDLPEIHVEEVKNDGRGSILSHLLSPATILEFCQKLYLKKPIAYLVSIKGYDFDFGNQLSPKIIENIPKIKKLVIDLASS